jgi:hypothetical protein
VAKETPEAILAARLRWQAGACEQIGSPLYAALLGRAAEDLEAHRDTWEVLRGRERDPERWLPALRLMGAVNRLVLSGEEPELARAYGSFAGDAGPAWQAFAAVLKRNAPELRQLLELSVQTNEVGRCAALLFGFQAVASETAMPLRLLEVGASAGLNLRWDRYRYRAEGLGWGPEDSPVQIEFELEGAAPPFSPQLEIVERRGCDADPIDASTPEGRLSLLAYVWPDQKTRVDRVRAALDLAADLPVRLDRESAVPWTRRTLAKPAPGRATVLYHSIVMQYLSDREREEFHQLVQEAGENATIDAPLAWLRMEPAGDHADLHLTTWPEGEERHLARTGYHGTPVHML